MCRRKVCGDLNGIKTHLQYTACLAHSMLGIGAQVHKHLFEMALHPTAMRHIVQSQFTIAQDRCENVVEVVRDPPCEGADRLYFLDLTELRFEARTLRNVTRHGEQHHLSLKLHGTGVHLGSKVVDIDNTSLGIVYQNGFGDTVKEQAELRFGLA